MCLCDSKQLLACILACASLSFQSAHERPSSREACVISGHSEPGSEAEHTRAAKAQRMSHQDAACDQTHGTVRFVALNRGIFMVRSAVVLTESIGRRR